MAKNYKNVGTLVRVFFGQDYDLFGETIEEILDSYLETENPKTAMKVYQETNDLLALNDGALTEAFGAISQREFCPEPWGETIRSFLEKVKSHFDNKLQLS